MGEVYLAEQTEPVRRRVALKIIKLGMDTKEIVARFESERQALAVMDHPHIARVYDAGATDKGRPYFVMELVSGVSLTEYCDTHRLDTRERLELFIKVCEGILHAHQKGIVHRDLKPSNIMIMVQSGHAVPKIIDFGIAKAMGRSLTDRTFVTAMGLPIGTPAYMSPEQAEMSGLDVDTRADIYTLGVILYELLSGTLPFDPSTITADFAAFQRQMRDTIPPVPSVRMSALGDKLPSVAEHRHTTPASLKRQLQGDLDWIVMKAMEKDRTRRYETVNALILEIRRHLNNEPVLARAPTMGYRVGKFVRRYKGWVTAAALAVSGLGVGLGTATYQWRQAETERARALQNLNMAIEAVDEMLVAVGDTLAFAGAPELEEIRESLFAKARTFYEQFRTQTTEPEYRLATALATQRLGDVYGLTGQTGEAESAYALALDSLRALSAQYPDRPRYRHYLADSYNWLGLQLAYRSPERARAAYDTALAVQEELIGSVPEMHEYRYHLARTLYNRGITLSTDPATAGDAERDYRAAIGHLEALIREDDHPEAPLADYRQELARSYNNLGNVLVDVGRVNEALGFFERAIGLMNDLSRTADNRAYKQELAMYNNNLAAVLWEGEDAEGAEVRSRRALELFEELAAPLVALDRERANSYGTLGAILMDLDSPERAESALRTSLEIWDRLAANVPELSRDPLFRARYGFTLLDLATLRVAAGDVGEAGELLSRAVDHHTAVSDNPWVDLCLDYQGVSQWMSGAYQGTQLSRAVSRALEGCGATR